MIRVSIHLSFEDEDEIELQGYSEPWVTSMVTVIFQIQGLGLG